ncbi:SDR family oxidoreductase [Pseudonocardia dioxanivorans]|jgi:NAD(P)-dependent dehydrogenase (short-subunit alcohol dehydrogenase family)|uniref:Alcohol dehydrogenase zinc-binding domain protein n=1 Tax=Pseudonocardia dioxanivorans (strain ATCC 55486 / DSM 44775 / JCM 13855 / CB1190) TaxID=675635 RepID=F4CW67_PSEUX|nr:SDR family oxidoreductase [Pseudonocardia dioxanivorans]AEA26481.1 Alcohol dehydrogenase zinc-binding domain protein [Pseudonocardia dioxanivorans CB1190]
MTALSNDATTRREPGLVGQTVVVIGGSSGIGLSTARAARAEGADVVLTARDPDRLHRAADDLGARRYAAFDAHDPDRLRTFFDGLPTQVDHVMVTAGSPYYAPLAEMDISDAARHVGDHVRLVLEVARQSARTVRPGGTLLLMGGTGGRRPAAGLAVTALLTVGLPALVAALAVELAPVRVNLVAAGFVDTPLSASLLGDELDARRAQLRASLPIRRVVTGDDVAALAVHLMVNSALTGAVYDVDGGQQLR